MGLFVSNLKQACPSVQTTVHSKWLMINGSIEKVQEGEGQHPCYRVYRHGMPFTEGTNVWVQFDSDKKCKTCFGIIVCCTCVTSGERIAQQVVKDYEDNH
jgi:hypothetical protein